LVLLLQALDFLLNQIKDNEDLLLTHFHVFSLDAGIKYMVDNQLHSFQTLALHALRINHLVINFFIFGSDLTCLQIEVLCLLEVLELLLDLAHRLHKVEGLLFVKLAKRFRQLSYLN